MKWEEDKYQKNVWFAEGLPEDVSVHHLMGYGEIWFVTCHRLGISRHELEAADIADALVEAEGVIRALVLKWAQALNGQLIKGD